MHNNEKARDRERAEVYKATLYYTSYKTTTLNYDKFQDYFYACVSFGYFFFFAEEDMILLLVVV